MNSAKPLSSPSPSQKFLIICSRSFFLPTYSTSGQPPAGPFIFIIFHLIPFFLQNATNPFSSGSIASNVTLASSSSDSSSSPSLGSACAGSPKSLISSTISSSRSSLNNLEYSAFLFSSSNSDMSLISSSSKIAEIFSRDFTLLTLFSCSVLIAVSWFLISEKDLKDEILFSSILIVFFYNLILYIRINLRVIMLFCSVELYQFDIVFELFLVIYSLALNPVSIKVTRPIRC